MGLLITYYVSEFLADLRGFLWILELNLSVSFSPDRIIMISGSVIVIICLILVIILNRRISAFQNLLNEKEQMLNLLEIQNEVLERKEKSIIDSLIYAQRIQEAMLASEDYFRNHFSSSFIFFKPKDIVSGDFYWIGEKGDRIFVVAADCTGHGVPGALVSMIGMEIIEKAISEDNIETPSGILDALNKGLEKTFSRKKNIGTIIRDGMDVGLCAVDKKRRKLVYSGAFFQLYLLRNNALTQINGDKIIIGMNPERIPYTDHEIDLQEEDMLYLFSDGYVDQFGGKDNKKFMYRRLRYLLLNIHKFDVRDQKSILDENIRAWMGSNTQVDDMMIIGFKPLENTK